MFTGNISNYAIEDAPRPIPGTPRSPKGHGWVSVLGDLFAPADTSVSHAPPATPGSWHPMDPVGFLKAAVWLSLTIGLVLSLAAIAG